jgi:hypothetical protein
MNPDESPATSRPIGEPKSADVEKLLEELPESYRVWEKASDTPELERIKLRIVSLMRDEGREASPDRPQ